MFVGSITWPIPLIGWSQNGLEKHVHFFQPPYYLSILNFETHACIRASGLVKQAMDFPCFREWTWTAIYLQLHTCGGWIKIRKYGVPNSHSLSWECSIKPLKWDTWVTWVNGGFQSHGGTPVHHPFIVVGFSIFFHHRGSPIYDHLWKPPNDGSLVYYWAYRMTHILDDEKTSGSWGWIKKPLNTFSRHSRNGHQTWCWKKTRICRMFCRKKTRI